MNTPSKVKFVNENIKNELYKLSQGRSEDKELFENITYAIESLKTNINCGIRIKEGRMPKTYRQKYGIEKILKYNLPNGWRLIYTIVRYDSEELICLILEWFDHNEYERRFKY